MQMNDPFNNPTHPKGKVISTIFFADKQGTPHATHKILTILVINAFVNAI